MNILFYKKKSGAATGGIYAAPDDGEVVNQILEVSKCLLYLITEKLICILDANLFYFDWQLVFYHQTMRVLKKISFFGKFLFFQSNVIFQ